MSASPVRIHELQERVHQMQGSAVSRPLDTVPMLADLVQLRTGGSYLVDNPALAMALMAGPSQAGAWSAVIGIPDFGIEAAAEFGVDLRRTLVIPHPAEHWLGVLASVIDVVTVVVVRPPSGVGDHQAARIRARLRQRGSALIVWGEWPRGEARLISGPPVWTGLGRGHGRITARQLPVTVYRGSSPPREVCLWLPDTDRQLRVAGEPRSGHRWARSG